MITVGLGLAPPPLKGLAQSIPELGDFFEKNPQNVGSDISELVGSTGLRFGHTTYH